MLQSIRDRLTGPIVWFVIGLICIPFAFWGIESFRSGSNADPALAKVGSDEISQSEFRQGYEQRYQQLANLMGENFRPDMIDQVRFRKNVLDDMVQESVLRQYTQDAGYRASDAALFDYLSSAPAFQEDGKFSAQRYRDLLTRRGMTTQGFEAQLRTSLAIDQLRESIVDSAFVSSDETALAYRIGGQTRDVDIARFSITQIKPTVEVADDAVADYYETNKSRYMAPERLKLAYVDLDIETLSKAPTPSDDVLKVLYDAEKESRFASTEERRARHILIAFGTDKSAAKNKLEALAKRIADGEDFAAIAKESSEDPGSKGQGGELGWVKRGMMVAKFEDALFKLKDGEVSAPVETEFGWHLIQVEETKPATIRPFEDASVRDELTELYQQRDLEKRFQEQSEQLEQLAFENPASLDAVAEALGLKVQTTDWFTRAGGPGILSEQAVKDAAFSPPVLTDNENSKPVSLAPTRVVVIRKAEYEAPRQRSLEEVKATVVDELQTEGAKKMAQTKADALEAAIRAGTSAPDAITAAGAALQHESGLARTATTPDRLIVDAAFRLPHPMGGQPSVGRVSLESGDLAVILLNSVQTPEAPTASVVGSTRSRLREATAGSEFSAVRQALEDDIKVEIMKPQETGEAAPADEGAGS